ncbi:MAG: 30S ribosomal protein S2 [Bacteroidetes bacterium]|nr:30S ribosomal protein S2 [Bacteroidota bacterium]
MGKITYQDLLEAGVHFGHLRKKWNPKMMPYIFMERKGIHIIDLNKTLESLEETAGALRAMARSGKKILFVATKKQAKTIVEEAANRVNMPYVTERWLGGMLTNFATIRKSIKKMQSIERMMNDGTFENITKKERLQLTREKAKLEKVLGGIANMSRLPAAIYIVDIGNEHIALAEAKRLNIPTLAMVDTNCDPTLVDYAVPANDDATKSIAIITEYLTNAIIEGLEERKRDKDEADAQNEGEEESRLSSTERVLLAVDEDSPEEGGGEGAKKPAAPGGRRRATGARRTGGGPKPAGK